MHKPKKPQALIDIYEKQQEAIRQLNQARAISSNPIRI